MNRTSITIIATLASALFVMGCTDAATEEFNDSGKIGNLDTPALRISMPDGFSNVAAKCVGTDMLYSAVNSNGRAVAVSPGHPWCADGELTIDEVRD